MLWLFAVAVAVLAVAVGLTAVLIKLLPAPEPAAIQRRMMFVFAASSFVLATGSIAQSRALGYVKREKQRPFRRWLVTAAMIGTVFLGVQSYGLWCLIADRVPKDAQVSADAFVFVLAMLHALHVGIAMMFLLFVTLRSMTDRYDHEYYWGVTVCTSMWHFLGIAWLFILAIFTASL